MSSVQNMNKNNGKELLPMQKKDKKIGERRNG